MFILNGMNLFSRKILPSKNGGFSSVLENALDAVVAMDSNGTVVHWNHQAEKIFGWKKEEALGKKMSETIIPHRYREAHERGLRRYLSTGTGKVIDQRLELTALHNQGHEFPVELTVTRDCQTSGPVFYAFLRDLTLQKQIEGERDELLVQLRSAVETRDKFIGIASHELKNPLTNLMLQIECIREGMGDPSRFLDQAERQVERIARLIDDMFDVARISSGQLEIDRVDFDFSVVLRNVIEPFMHAGLKDPIRCTLSIPDSLRVCMDQARIEQVLVNLISNAKKYGRGKPIEVRVSADEQQVNLFVRDQGIGIPKDLQSQIFLPYERVHADEKVSGLGLGLYISKQIVDAHNGHIHVESEPGRGSVFIVTLPRYQL